MARGQRYKENHLAHRVTQMKAATRHASPPRGLLTGTVLLEVAAGGVKRVPAAAVLRLPNRGS